MCTHSCKSIHLHIHILVQVPFVSSSALFSSIPKQCYKEGFIAAELCFGSLALGYWQKRTQAVVILLGMGWDRMGWGGMGCNGLGCNGLGWHGTAWHFGLGMLQLLVCSGYFLWGARPVGRLSDRFLGRVLGGEHGTQLGL